MAPRLRDSPEDSSFTSRIGKGLRKVMRRAVKSTMKSHRVRIPNYDFPIRLRPWFLLLTSLIIILLAFLGFTDFVRRLPLNDRDARRIWIWRNTGLILTGVVCFFFGGVVSEIVQSMLPYKRFDIGDVIANILGSALGLWVAYHLERYYRHRREISRLYQPLSAEEDELPSDSESEPGFNNGTARGVPLLPTYRLPPKSAPPRTQRQIRIGNVWDESEELFGIGEDDEEEHGEPGNGDTLPATQASNVKIVVTGP